MAPWWGEHNDESAGVDCGVRCSVVMLVQDNPGRHLAAPGFCGIQLLHWAANSSGLDANYPPPPLTMGRRPPWGGGLGGGVLGGAMGGSLGGAFARASTGRSAELDVPIVNSGHCSIASSHCIRIFAWQLSQCFLHVRVPSFGMYTCPVPTPVGGGGGAAGFGLFAKMQGCACLHIQGGCSLALLPLHLRARLHWCAQLRGGEDTDNAAWFHKIFLLGRLPRHRPKGWAQCTVVQNGKRHAGTCRTTWHVVPCPVFHPAGTLCHLAARSPSVCPL